MSSVLGLTCLFFLNIAATKQKFGSCNVVVFFCGDEGREQGILVSV